MAHTIRFTVNKNIGTVILSNPPDNVLTLGMVNKLKEIQSFIKDKAIRGLIIHGEGSNFCAGPADTINDKNEFLNRLNEICIAIAYAPVPIVAAIKGSCLDAGFLLAMHCHTIFASPHTLMGFTDDAGWEMMNQSAIPSRGSKQTTGQFKGTITGSEAERRGLIDKTEPDQSIISYTEHHVQSLVENRPLKLIRTVMESIHNARRLPYVQALHQESALFNTVVKSAAIDMRNANSGTGYQS